MEYQVRSKYQGQKEFVASATSLNKALEIAAIQLDHHSVKDNRTGSLRGDGEVIMWEEGERVGYVIVEQRAARYHTYEKIGG